MDMRKNKRRNIYNKITTEYENGEDLLKNLCVKYNISQRTFQNYQKEFNNEKLNKLI